METSVSVILATYNGEKYISCQLESILNQTHLPLQIIVTDDGSTDSTIEIVNSFISKYPLITLSVNTKQKGYGENFISKINECDGDYILFADQDDYWYPQKIERMLSIALNNSDKDVFMCDVLFASDSLVPYKCTKINQIKKSDPNLKSYVMGCASLLRSDFAKRFSSLPNGYIAHDSWLIGLASIFDKKYIINEVLQLYRRHDNNTSNAEFNIIRRRKLSLSIFSVNQIKEKIIKKIHRTNVKIRSLKSLNSLTSIEKEYINYEIKDLYIIAAALQFRLLYINQNLLLRKLTFPLYILRYLFRFRNHLSIKRIILDIIAF